MFYVVCLGWRVKSVAFYVVCQGALEKNFKNGGAEFDGENESLGAHFEHFLWPSWGGPHRRPSEHAKHEFENPMKE